MTDDVNFERRTLLQVGLYTLAVPTALSLFPVDARSAEELPKLALDDPQAQALQYVHDANQAAKARNKGEFCHNCRFWKSGKNQQWGECQIFPGKRVNGDGWCSSYAKS